MKSAKERAEALKNTMVCEFYAHIELPQMEEYLFQTLLTALTEAEQAAYEDAAKALEYVFQSMPKLMPEKVVRDLAKERLNQE